MTAILGATPVHPRMRARRIEVERHQGRRRRRWIIAVGVVLALVAAAVIFLQSSWVDVRAVEVTGTAQTPPEAVLDAAGIAPGSSMLGLDLEGARRAVARLPWVDEVRATADWSGQVVLDISERQPVAQIATANGFSVVDNEGRVVAFSSDAHPGLPVIGGVGGAAAGAWLAADSREPIAVAAAVGPDLLYDIGSVTRDADGAIYLELNRGGRVLIGDTRELEAKMIAVETIIGQVEMACVGVIDVRAATAPVITRAC